MSKQATIWIKDEVNCTIMGLDERSIQNLWKTFGFYVHGYMHRPMYKLGTWDGKKRFFSKLGNTYVYLIPQIVKILRSEGYALKLKDDRNVFEFPSLSTGANPFPDFVDYDGSSFELRPYQIDAVNAVLKHNGGIMLAGTGSGKTAMSATIARMYEQVNFRTIIIVPTTSLVKQSADDLKKWGLDCGQYDGTTKELHTTHLVSTWQSLQNVPTLLAAYQVVVVDECQAAQASILAGLLEKNGRHISCRFGLTGTMPKDVVDNMQVKVMLGDIKYEIPAWLLIEQGYLSTLNIEMMELDEQIPSNQFPDYASESAYLRTSKERTTWIIELAKKLAAQPNGNTMVLVSSKTHGRKLASQIPGSYFISGDDAVDNRAVIYKLFAENDNLIVFITVQVGGTGLSIDRVFNLIVLDIGKSFIRTIQAIGRGLRKNVRLGKSHVNVFDVFSGLTYSRKHSKDRLKFYIDAKYPVTKTQIKYKSDVDSLT